MRRNLLVVAVMCLGALAASVAEGASLTDISGPPLWATQDLGSGSTPNDRTIRAGAVPDPAYNLVAWARDGMGELYLVSQWDPRASNLLNPPGPQADVFFGAALVSVTGSPGDGYQVVSAPPALTYGLRPSADGTGWSLYKFGSGTLVTTALYEQFRQFPVTFDESTATLLSSGSATLTEYTAAGLFAATGLSYADQGVPLFLWHLAGLSAPDALVMAGIRCDNDQVWARLDGGHDELVPEPGTWACGVAVGGFGLLAVRRRRAARR